MIGFFGPVIFKTGGFPDVLPSWTFHQFGRQRKMQYATHDILNGGQVLQYMGQELETIDLAIHLSNDLVMPSGMNPRVELELLALLAAQGTAQILIIGYLPLGNFVIEDIGEVWKRVSSSGALTAADVNLKLREYA